MATAMFKEENNDLLFQTPHAPLPTKKNTVIFGCL